MRQVVEVHLSTAVAFPMIRKKTGEESAGGVMLHKSQMRCDAERGDETAEKLQQPLGKSSS